MLWVVATPLGDPQDITVKALGVLKDAEIIICESTKEASKLLRVHGIAGKRYEVLDEHSKPEDRAALRDLCRAHLCALVSDCGTPAFCDPGADLVAMCRATGIEVKICPGPSSLMGLLMLSGCRLDQFLFRGFVPAETEARRKAWQDLQKEKRPFVVMDTPYRLKKTLGDLVEFFPQRSLILVMDLTQATEQVLTGRAAELAAKTGDRKAEFLILVEAEG